MIEHVASDPYNRAPSKVPKSERPSHKTELIPVPVVDLPLGATEDRVCGTIDIEKALTSGKKAFEPGLLAQANRGFLYIDEVNLLDDHLVDVLLDVAASGVNVVEREGISIRHPARFVLVGSGNPEEGELRPQLLDRFGLHARITTINKVQDRVEIVKRRREFDFNPDAFLKQWKPQQEALREKIVRAQSLLPSVTMPDEVLMKVATLCMRLGIDGHRGELTITRAASATLPSKAERKLRSLMFVRLPRLPCDTACDATHSRRLTPAKKSSANFKRFSKLKNPFDMLSFTNILGLDLAKKALLLAAVDSSLGGVLIPATVGSGKSTLARAFAHILPEGTPFVELPLNITEDRLLGGLDLEVALSTGKRVIEKGLLAKANGGVLYVDSFNLLDSTSEAYLIDALSRGKVLIERDGISDVHEARFILVGTYNPAEGDVRMGLLDRIGLIVPFTPSVDEKFRAEVVRRVHFQSQRDDDADEDKILQGLILQARDLLPRVEIRDEEISGLV
jgi:magnesium chelatase subunit I